jgi:hypothetical protein
MIRKQPAWTKEGDALIEVEVTKDNITAPELAKKLIEEGILKDF